jgi:hypothetical protein
VYVFSSFCASTVNLFPDFTLDLIYIVDVEDTASFNKHRTEMDSDVQNYVEFASDTRQNPLYSFGRRGKWF